ncbi:Cytochrome P450 4f11, partial [Halocaridina rubra]
ITAGEHDLTKADGTEQTRNIQEILIHEDYNSRAYPYDIALLKLSHPLTLDTYAQSVPLPYQGQIAHGNCIVSGWGKLSEGGISSNTLQKVTLPIVSEEECKLMYNGEPGSEIDDTMICAGVIEGGKDACQGDSGGPLVCTENGIQYLGGIVSWGKGCAKPGFPGVYARVSFFVDWIENYIDSDNVSGWLKVSKGEIPHQISLQMKGDFITSSFCSGSILSENWVVTTAQCVNGHDKRDLQ